MKTGFRNKLLILMVMISASHTVSARTAEAPLPVPDPDLTATGVQPLRRRGSEAPVRPSAADPLAYAEWLRSVDAEKSLAQYNAFIEDSTGADLVWAAHLGRAKTLMSLGRYEEAFEAVEKSYPPEAPPAKLLDERVALEMRLARRFMRLAAAEGTGAKNGSKSESSYQTASRIFEAVLYNDPGGSYAPAALVGLARARYGLGDLKGAEKRYLQALSRDLPEPVANAARLGAARCFLERRTGPSIQAERLRQAEQLLDAVVAVQSDAAQQEQQRVRHLLDCTEAERQLEEARFYLDRGGRRARRAAQHLLRRLIRDHPGTPAAQSARRHIKDLEASLGKKEVEQ